LGGRAGPGIRPQLVLSVEHTGHCPSARHARQAADIGGVAGTRFFGS
jgi:hypothetical protein